MSFLNTEEPDLVELVKDIGIKLAWHPSLSPEYGDDALRIVDDLTTGKKKLDFLVLEGAIARGPNNTGSYHVFGGRPFAEFIKKAAAAARFVIALGSCACWGGIPASNPNTVDATGLQFHKDEKGGLLGTDFRSRGGMPVINVPGCPAHPTWITHTLVALNESREVELDKYNRPSDFFSTLSHEGCTRALYHEYKMAAEKFGDSGCLFFELGCRGPITYSACNDLLWNGQSTKPRSGVPCVGCTEPEFPDYPEQGFFRRYAITPALGVRMLPYLITAPFARLVAPEQRDEK
jgi:hydrogenase small subunit